MMSLNVLNKDNPSFLVFSRHSFRIFSGSGSAGAEGNIVGSISRPVLFKAIFFETFRITLSWASNTISLRYCFRIPFTLSLITSGFKVWSKTITSIASSPTLVL